MMPGTASHIRRRVLTTRRRLRVINPHASLEEHIATVDSDKEYSEREGTIGKVGSFGSVEKAAQAYCAVYNPNNPISSLIYATQEYVHHLSGINNFEESRKFLFEIEQINPEFLRRLARIILLECTGWHDESKIVREVRREYSVLKESLEGVSAQLDPYAKGLMFGDCYELAIRDRNSERKERYAQRVVKAAKKMRTYYAASINPDRNFSQQEKFMMALKLRSHNLYEAIK